MLPCDSPSFRGQKEILSAFCPQRGVCVFQASSLPKPGVHTGALIFLLFLNASVQSLDLTCYLICPRASITPSFSSRDWELAVLPPTSSSSSGLAPSLVWRQQAGPPGLGTALTSEPPQGLHQPRDPAHSPHLHRYHLGRLQLHVLDSGGAVQMSPLRGAHLNPAPPFPGERPKLLPAQGVPDILWERHTASACLLVSGLPYTRVPPNLLEGHGHTHTHLCGGKPPWSCPESGMRSPERNSGCAQPCRPRCSPFTCLEGTTDLAASPLTHRALGTPPEVEGSALAQSHASISQAPPAPQARGSWWSGVCGLCPPVLQALPSGLHQLSCLRSPLTAGLPGKASLPGCSSLW